MGAHLRRLPRGGAAVLGLSRNSGEKEEGVTSKGNPWAEGAFPGGWSLLIILRGSGWLGSRGWMRPRPATHPCPALSSGLCWNIDHGGGVGVGAGASKTNVQNCAASLRMESACRLPE